MIVCMVFQATDADTLNGSIVWFEIVTPQVPYLVDRDTGVVTTAGVFRGLTGTRYNVEVRAFDNFGNSPSFSTAANMEVRPVPILYVQLWICRLAKTLCLQVLVFKITQQVIHTFNLPKEDIEVKLPRIER